jgi:hypothetical protein
MLGLILHRRLGELQGWSILRSASKAAFAAATAAGLTGWLAWMLLEPTRSRRWQAMLLGGIGGAGVVCDGGLRLALRGEEAMVRLRLAGNEWRAGEGRWH